MSTIDSLKSTFGISSSPDWQRRKRLKRYGLYIGMVLLSLVYFFPMYWMIKSSFQPRSALFTAEASLRVFPTILSLSNLEQLFFSSDFLTFYKNSLIVVVGVMVITLVTSTMAGYTLTRIDIPGKRTIANITIFSYMYPPLLLVIPMFLLWFSVGLINTHLGLILAQTALTVPFSIWLMWQFFQTVSIELEESAWIYGASRTRAFFDIALPLAKPGLVAVAIFAFAVSWNDFTMANILMQKPEMRTLPVGVLFFTEEYTVDWGLVLSASLFIAIPPFLLVYFLQRYLLRGFQVTS